MKYDGINRYKNLMVPMMKYDGINRYKNLTVPMMNLTDITNLLTTWFSAKLNSCGSEHAPTPLLFKVDGMMHCIICGRMLKAQIYFR
jgi:hypothetical protein